MYRLPAGPRIRERAPEVIVDGERRRAEIAVTYPEGRPARYTYHPVAGGLWIELVHTSFRAQLASWIAETVGDQGPGLGGGRITVIVSVEPLR